MPDNYWGPAGIFSTDNPQSDQMQIDAESYVDPEDEEPVEDESEIYDPCPDCGRYTCDGNCQIDTSEKQFAVFADCPEQWYDYELSIDESKVDEQIQSFTNKHARECKCKAEVRISVVDAVTKEEVKR